MDKNLMQAESDIIPYRNDNGVLHTIESGSVQAGVYNEKNVIPTNQYARAMRMAMEDKNLLIRAGSLYVGTGKTQTVSPYEDSELEIEVPITAPLNPPLQDGTYVLTCIVVGGKATLSWVKQ